MVELNYTLILFSIFAAMFLAKISKGRTIKQFLFCSVVAPSLYCFVYPAIFGGVGLRLERDSSAIGLCCKEDTGWFHNPKELFDIASERHVLNSTITTDDSNLSWMCEGKCSKCAISTMNSKAKVNLTYKEMIHEYEFLGDDFGSATVDRSLSRPSCHILVQMIFDVMRSVPGLGTFMSGFILCAMIIYFTTASDSGSLIIDSLAANGDFDSSPYLRAFWALTEGATATALLVAGGTDSLTAVQSMGIISAFPMSVIICLACVATWKALRITTGDAKPRENEFAFSLLEPLAARPYKK